MVLITGDLVDSEAAFLPGTLEPLARISAPVYYVGGNHEKYVDAERAFASVKQYGVNVLRNQVVETHGLQLVGLDYMNADEHTFELHPSRDPRTIKSVLASLHLEEGTPSVLLHHSPTGAQYATAKGIDLMIAGHTHGGQFFPGTLVSRAVFPFTHGLYQRGPLQVFVSQRGGDVHVSRATRHLKRAEHPAIEADTIEPLRLASVRQMATCRYRQSPSRSSGINHLALALALLFTGAEDPGSALMETMRMTYRIERSTSARGVTFLLSGEMDSSHVAELEALMAAESSCPVLLDLAEAKGSHAVYVSQPRAVADLIAKAASGVAVATR